MSAELLSSVAGIVLSLIFSYVPGVRTWYDQFNPDYKRLVMLVLLAVVAVGVFGLSCAWLYQWVPCDQSCGVKLVEIFVMALIANQTTFLISPKPVVG